MNLSGPGWTVALLLCSVLLGGCWGSSIPDRVSQREYDLYSAWMNQAFQKRPPKSLILYSQTSVFDPLTPIRCGEEMHGKDGVDWELMRQLHALGTTVFPLDFSGGQKGLHLAWNHKVVDSLIADPQLGTRTLSFTRVAFNDTGDTALFAVTDTCGGECGFGGAILAHRSGGNWQFQRTHCQWKY